MELKVRKVKDVAVFDISGRLSIGEPTLLLRETLRRYVADGTSRFVLNLGEVSHIDSAGLGELITTYTTLRNRGRNVILLHLTKKSKDLLQMTKLLTVFDCYDDEAKAIAALASKEASQAE